MWYVNITVRKRIPVIVILFFPNDEADILHLILRSIFGTIFQLSSPYVICDYSASRMGMMMYLRTL